MILLSLVLLPLVGSGIWSALPDGTARWSLSRAVALGEFVLALASAIRGESFLTGVSWGWADFAGWSLVLTGHASGVIFAMALSGAYLSALLDGKVSRSGWDGVLLFSMSGAMIASLAGSWSTALVGWFLAWGPLLAVVGLGPDPAARAAARRAARYGALAFGFILAADILAGSGRPHSALASALLLVGLALSSGLFPVHGWLSQLTSKTDPLFGGLAGTLGSKLLVIHWLRQAMQSPPGPVETHWLQGLALLTIVHAALVGWTFRRDVRASFAPVTAAVNALVILGGLSGTKAGFVGSVLLASGQVVAAAGLWSCLRREHGESMGVLSTGWFLLGLPGSAAFVGFLGVLTGLFRARSLPAFGFFDGHSHILHARLTAVGALVGYILVLAAMGHALYHRFYESLPPGGMSPAIGARTGRQGGTLPGWFVAVVVGLLLGLVPAVWSKRLAPLPRQKAATTLSERRWNGKASWAAASRRFFSGKERSPVLAVSEPVETGREVH